MPTDWENNVIIKRPGMKTRFCSVQIDDPQSCNKYFGKYNKDGMTILCCEPARPSCDPFIIM